MAVWRGEWGVEVSAFGASFFLLLLLMMMTNCTRYEVLGGVIATKFSDCVYSSLLICSMPSDHVDSSK